MNENRMRIDAGLRRRRPRFSRQWSSSAPPAASSIGTRSPPLSLGAAHKLHKRCTTSCLRPTLSYAFAHPPHRSPRPPASSGVRACGAVVRLTPWIGSGIGSAVRARKGSLRLGRSPPDPPPPKSRLVGVSGRFVQNCTLAMIAQRTRRERHCFHMSIAFGGNFERGF